MNEKMSTKVVWEFGISFWRWNFLLFSFLCPDSERPLVGTLVQSHLLQERKMFIFKSEEIGVATEKTSFLPLSVDMQNVIT